MEKVEDRSITIPGQLIGKDIQHGINCFHEGTGVFSSVQGLVRKKENMIDVIPAFGSYTPSVGDVVIGVIVDITPGSWIVDINFPSKVSMSGEEVTRDPIHADLKKFFDIGDKISAKISNVDEVNSTTLVRPLKLRGGRIIEICPKRVPRVVGRKSSMLDMIKGKTECKIVVGQNGRIWIDGENAHLAEKAIRKVEREAQTKGLTDRVADMLNNESRSDEKNGERKKE